MGNTREELLRHYTLAREGVALLHRADRGMIEVSGADRGAWLHNLVTNVIKGLPAGEGNYAFACNVKGRVLFDLNMLVLDDPAAADGRIWLDIDAGWIADAMKHFDRYIIAEKVTLADRSAAFGRLAVLGPRAADVMGRIGFGRLAAMAQLQHGPLGEGDSQVRVVRHDFAGVPAAELIVAAARVDEVRGKLLQAGREFDLAEISPEVADVLRIEAGIPASRRDIDADVLPAETGQVERGISYHKGCYLGQEVVERMRSHAILARKLVGVRLDGTDTPAAGSLIHRGEAEIGRVTSACWSFALGAPLCLGYVKSAHAVPDTPVTVAESLPGRITALPARS